ncbi:phage integrase SAM-like domain-containing protein [Galbibacter pacificus]|uniref:phage integrase SAM-like domain-containing protein n=1 Tax=Galbibacter pacificus TaxID=2996052 RepID=UPI0038B3C64B
MFFDLAKEHLDELEAYNKHNRHSSDSAYIGYIYKFNRSRQLSFKEIDERFLNKLKIYLIQEHSLCLVSIMNVFVLVRMLYNKAIKARIVKKKLYPFGSDKIRIKFPETEKVGLDIDEIQRIESLDNLTYGETHTVTSFLLIIKERNYPLSINKQGKLKKLNFLKTSLKILIQS